MTDPDLPGEMADHTQLDGQKRAGLLGGRPDVPSVAQNPTATGPLHWPVSSYIGPAGGAGTRLNSVMDTPPSKNTKRNT